MALDVDGGVGRGTLSGRDSGRSERPDRTGRRLLCPGKPFGRDARPSIGLASFLGDRRPCRRRDKPGPDRSRRSIRTDLPVRLLVAVARARLMLAKGDTEMATEVLEHAADLVDRHRILLSATEARAGVSLLADEIAGLGFEAIHGTGDPPSVGPRDSGGHRCGSPPSSCPGTPNSPPTWRNCEAWSVSSRSSLSAVRIRELAAEAHRLERRIGDLSVAREQAADTVVPPSKSSSCSTRWDLPDALPLPRGGSHLCRVRRCDRTRAGRPGRSRPAEIPRPSSPFRAPPRNSRCDPAI